MCNRELTLIESLGNELKQMYVNAPKNEKTTMIHLFGIINGDTILDNYLNVKKIVRASGIHSSYQAEIRKGVKLSKYVEVKPNVILPN